MNLITSPTLTHRNNGIDPRESIPADREIGRPEITNGTAVKRPRILAHPVAQHALTTLRDRRTRVKHLRAYSNQLLTILALEATTGIPLRDATINLESGVHTGKALGKPVVFLSLTRHGLGLSHNVSEIIPGVSIGSISLENSGGREQPEPRLHLTNAPALQEARVILFDPAVSSGSMVALALQLLRKSGANDLVVASFVMSMAGMERVLTVAPSATVITTAVDDFDAKRGLRPGIGDFAERLYATD